MYQLSFYIETEKPRYWLKEAYSSAIIDADTGIIGRNSTLSKISAMIFLIFCDKRSKVWIMRGDTE